MWGGMDDFEIEKYIYFVSLFVLKKFVYIIIVEKDVFLVSKEKYVIWRKNY